MVVKAVNRYGQASSTSATSGPIASGIPAVNAPPVISGTARQGQTLTTNSGTWSPTGTSYSYQWQRFSNKGSTLISDPDADLRLALVHVAPQIFKEDAARSRRCSPIPDPAVSHAAWLTLPPALADLNRRADLDRRAARRP